MTVRARVLSAVVLAALAEPAARTQGQQGQRFIDAALAESEKMLEIDFAGGRPSAAADQFGKGKKR